MTNISIQEFVSREVIYCVSSLVSTLITAAGEVGNVGDISQDELYSLCQRDDWETPAREYIDGMSHSELVDALEAHSTHDREGLESRSEGGLREWLLTTAADDWQGFAETWSVEPYQNEVYEHWIVTDWLASKLEAKGEIVARDIAGLTIWGRCTTGQRISMDGVMQEIYNEMIGA